MKWWVQAYLEIAGRLLLEGVLSIDCLLLVGWTGLW